MARTSLEEKAMKFCRAIAQQIGMTETLAYGQMVRLYNLTQDARIEEVTKDAILDLCLCPPEFAEGWFKGLQTFKFISQLENGNFLIEGNKKAIKSIKKSKKSLSKGGKKRATTAKRDEKGHFKKGPAETQLTSSSSPADIQLSAETSTSSIQLSYSNSYSGSNSCSDSGSALTRGTDHHPSADASGQSSPKKARLQKTPIEKTAPSYQVWHAYVEAYKARYKQEPPYNAKSFGQCGHLIARVGFEDAKLLVSFYLQHNKGFYVEKCHMLTYCLSDAEALLTQMRANFKVTSSFARDTDRKQSNQQVFENFAAERGIKL
jgi:hypothetical protein